jgi:two-component system osmolarity sensor histidine kinase EnvZ
MDPLNNPNADHAQGLNSSFEGIPSQLSQFSEHAPLGPPVFSPFRKKKPIPWYRQFTLSLFWRTFILLAMLLGCGVYAWMATFRALEFEPRAVQAAQQIASLVNLSRTALQYSNKINRLNLIKDLTDQDTVKIQPGDPNDRYEPFEVDRLSTAIAQELRSRLGTATIVASGVNGHPGLWVGFTIDSDRYWLRADPQRIQPVGGVTYFVWISIALLATVFGSAAIAGLINRPLEQLSFAAGRIQNGEFDAARLDEATSTREIREVNQGFNRMARELARLEKDRAVMLAGISHDLRTPLARLRLEAEMSVSNEDARKNMADDIDQLDGIIGKFMDYARPTKVKLVPIDAAIVVEREAAAFRNPEQIQIHSDIPRGTFVQADNVELGRIIANLFENARRYGRTPTTGIAQVEVHTVKAASWVILSVRDYGRGVPTDRLNQLTTPFFRGDAARTHATGAGLGLAIVNKNVKRMGGVLELENADDGGFVVHIRLKRADLGH